MFLLSSSQSSKGKGKNKGKALAKKVKKSVTRTEDSDDEIEDRELCCICNRFQPDGLRLDMAISLHLNFSSNLHLTCIKMPHD
jgi:hypothetical protein